MGQLATSATSACDKRLESVPQVLARVVDTRQVLARVLDTRQVLAISGEAVCLLLSSLVFLVSTLNSQLFNLSHNLSEGVSE